MKKQKMVLLGSLALVILLSVVLIVLMTRPQQEQPQESGQSDQQQELELLSMTVEQINTISVKNPAGGFVLVNQGSGFVVEGYEEVATSGINVNNLTANFTSLRAKRLLLSQEELTLGSSNEQLGQYGLDNPQYSIQIVTTDGNNRNAFTGAIPRRMAAAFKALYSGCSLSVGRPAAGQRIKRRPLLSGQSNHRPRAGV